MPKFILIEHSIRDYQGHYFEYAVRVAKAAEAMGYTPILATNRQFKAGKNMSWKVYPIYKYAFWLHWAEPRWYSWRKWFTSLSTIVKRWTFRLKMSFLFSFFGFFWSIRNQMGDYLRRHALDIRFNTRSFFLMFSLVHLLKLTRSFVKMLWGIIPFHGYLRLQLAHLKSFAQLIIYPILLLTRPRDWMKHWLWDQARTRQFSRDTRSLFRKIKVEDGDIIFIPTSSAVEATGLSQYLQKDPKSIKGTWILLFRHQLHSIDSPGPQQEDMRFVLIRDALLQFRTKLSGHKVYFYTDSDDLTIQYNSLKIVPFETLPIPISKEFFEFRRTHDRDSVLQISYVGDARKEKGYQHLPRIIQDLWLDYVKKDKIHFVIQSNFNVPGGTAQTAVARMQLECYSQDKVTLLKETLNSNEYLDLVRNSDIILLPYDQDAYYAGSSGILGEALVSGVPVIIPERTWMAKQFADQIYDYHDSLKRTLKTLKHRNGKELKWGVDFDDRNPMSLQGFLSLGTGVLSPDANIIVPAFSEFLIISFGPSDEAAGFVSVYVDQLNEKKHSVLKGQVSISESTHARPSVLIRLEKDARRILLSFSKGSGNATPEISDIDIHFLARHKNSQRCPLSTIGLIYRDPDDITDFIREIIDNYPHYRDTAHAFAVSWFEKHNADSLVAELQRVSKYGVDKSATLKQKELQVSRGRK
jgi:hypothetical protein